MTPESFCYWLQGFTELTRGQAPDAAQWKSIVEHLGLVFGKVTPSVQPVVTPVLPDDLAERLRKAAESAKPAPVRDAVAAPAGLSIEEQIRRMQDAMAERERKDSMRYPGVDIDYIGTGLGIGGPVITC